MPQKRLRKNKRFHQNMIDSEGNATKESIDQLRAELNALDNNENPALQAAERKVLAGTWIQTFGNVLEAVGVTEELLILQEEAETEGEDENFSGEKKAVLGVWFQTIGTGLGAIGFTQQLLPNREMQIQGRKLAIIGSWLDSYGAALEALGETQLLREDLEEDVPF
ncbi:hypothetical protein [Evansella halocellulosilytica]|uniref:hypothetical protein n=1 Tax=Evansella halocellulosilytica TaxID=2011013 RepID=UPI000BB768CD|nr:hypothetical protein [Evansella halocellulosilytica]